MIKRNIGVFVVRAIGMLLLFTMHTIIARDLGSEGYGIFSFALSIAAVAGVVAPLGWPTALVRLIAEYRRSHSWSLMRGAMNSATRTALAGAVIISGVILVVSVLVEGERGISLFFSALLVPLSAFIALRRKVLIAFRRPFQSIIPDELLLPALVIAVCLIVGVSDAQSTLSIYLALLTLVTLVSGGLAQRAYQAEIPRAKPEYRLRKWMSLALPMAFSGVSQIMVNRLDIVILGVIATPSEVGVYAAATRFASLLAFGLGAVAVVVPPMLAAAYTSGSRSDFQAVMRKSSLFSGSIAVFTGLPLLLWPQYLLGLFGAGYASASDLLRVLAVGQIVSAIAGPVGFALLLSGAARRFILYQLFAGMLGVMAYVIVYPIFGMHGVAVVTSIMIISVNAVAYVDVVWLRFDAPGSRR